MKKVREMMYVDEGKYYDLVKENKKLKFQIDEFQKSVKVMDIRIKEYEEAHEEEHETKKEKNWEWSREGNKDMNRKRNRTRMMTKRKKNNK